jgi:hypothetical protein
MRFHSFYSSVYLLPWQLSTVMALGECHLACWDYNGVRSHLVITLAAILDLAGFGWPT